MPAYHTAHHTVPCRPQFILDEALTRYILPNFAKEVHVRLLSDARAYMLRKVQGRVWRLATEVERVAGTHGLACEDAHARRACLTRHQYTVDTQSTQKHTTQPPVRLYDEDESLIEMPTIAAVCWGPGRPPTTFVLVDHTGAVRETLALAHFSGDLRPRRRADELEYSLFKDPVKVRMC